MQQCDAGARSQAGGPAPKTAAIIPVVLGFREDTAQSIEHDVEIIKHELPVDYLEFFVHTPQPGSEDLQKLARSGVAMNRYDLEHVCTEHGQNDADGVARRLPPCVVAILEHGADRDAVAAYNRRRHGRVMIAPTNARPAPRRKELGGDESKNHGRCSKDRAPRFIRAAPVPNGERTPGADHHHKQPKKSESPMRGPDANLMRALMGVGRVSSDLPEATPTGLHPSGQVWAKWRSSRTAKGVV